MQGESRNRKLEYYEKSRKRMEYFQYLNHSISKIDERMDQCQLELEVSRHKHIIEEQYLKRAKFNLQEKELLRIAASISQLTPQYEKIISLTKEHRPKIDESHHHGEESRSKLVLNLLKYCLYMQEHEMKLTTQLQRIVHQDKIIPQLSDTELNIALKNLIEQWIKETQQQPVENFEEDEDSDLISVIIEEDKELEKAAAKPQNQIEIEKTLQPSPSQNLNSNYSHRIGSYPVHKCDSPQKSNPTSPNRNHNSSHQTDKKKACIIN